MCRSAGAAGRDAGGIGATRGDGSRSARPPPLGGSQQQRGGRGSWNRQVRGQQTLPASLGPPPQGDAGRVGMIDSAEDRDPVEQRADEFASRLREGETPSIAEYSRR